MSISGREVETKQPNFIIVLADDVSPWFFTLYGAEEAHTPNIDRMAAEGVAFESGWATPICSPTRAMIMTGKYAGKTGWWHNSLKTEEDNDFRLNHPEFARRLQDEGYTSGLFGKWQLPGYPFDEISNYDRSIFWPGSPGGPESRFLYDTLNFQGPLENERTGVASRFWHPFLIKDGSLLETGPDDFSEDILTDHIIDLLKSSSKKPIVAYYTMLLPHRTASSKYPSTPQAGQVGDLENGTFQDCVNYIDVVVGRLLEAAESLNNQRPTVILFTGDNGMPWKANAGERGTRVPYIWWSSDRNLVIPRGLVNGKAHLVDVAPTLMDLAGVDLDPDFDGISMAPYLRGDNNDLRNELYSYIGTARIFRTEEFLWEFIDDTYNHPDGIYLWRHFGTTDRNRYKRIEHDHPEYAQIIRHLHERLDHYPKLDPTDPNLRDALLRYDQTPPRHGPNRYLNPMGELELD